MVHLPLSSKTLHVSGTNAVIGVVLCWLGVFAWVFREWHSLVLESGGFRMTCLHGNEQKLHPRLCWNHDFSHCHMCAGEFLAQLAFTMFHHKHGRVATLLCHFDARNWSRLPFDSPPDGKTFSLGREDCRTTCKMHQSPCKYMFILSCSPTRTIMLSLVMDISFLGCSVSWISPQSKVLEFSIWARWNAVCADVAWCFDIYTLSCRLGTKWRNSFVGDSSGLSFPARSLSWQQQAISAE